MPNVIGVFGILAHVMATEHVDGAAIKRLREARQWTQGELAYHAKVDQSLISKVESGERTDLRVSTVKKLAVALGVPVSRIIGEIGDAPDIALDDITLDHVSQDVGVQVPLSPPTRGQKWPLFLWLGPILPPLLALVPHLAVVAKFTPIP